MRKTILSLILLSIFVYADPVCEGVDVEKVKKLYEKETKDISYWFEGNNVLCKPVVKGNEALVFILYRQGEDDNYGVSLAIALYDGQKEQVVKHFFIEDYADSDAYFIRDIVFDVKTFSSISPYPSFSSIVEKSGSSQVNPFSHKNITIYEFKEEKLNKLFETTLEEVSGENNGNDVGEISFKKSKYMGIKSSKVYPDLTFENSYEYRYYNEKTEQNWKVNYGKRLFVYREGKYELVNKNLPKLFDLKKIEEQTKKGLKFKSVVLRALMKEEWVNKKNVESFNNIAYYLSKSGHDKEAVVVLENIIHSFPKRTVAYYNLADAYWTSGKKKKARDMYDVYVKQRKSEGLSVPKKVLGRLK